MSSKRSIADSTNDKPTKKRKSRKSTSSVKYPVSSQDDYNERNDEDFFPEDFNDQESVTTQPEDEIDVSEENMGEAIDKSEGDYPSDEDEKEIKVDKKKQAKQAEVIKLARLTVGDLGIDSLEDMESINVQSHFKLKDDYKNILILDIGSSFSKGYLLTRQGSKGRNFKRTVLSFRDEFCPGFLKTTLYYCTISEEFSLDPKELPSPVEVTSIKKLFTVVEAQQIAIENKKISVKELMIQFIDCLLKSIHTFPRKENLISKKMDCFIFTVPTETPLHIKQHYKSCIMQAIKTNFIEVDHITFDDIYVIEEYVLLFNADVDDDNRSISMLVDIGHLTTDTTVINKERKIIYANGEVGGVSVVHSAIEENNGKPFEFMKEVFSTKYSEEERLPDEYQHLEQVIEEACRKITTPLLDVILQNRPNKIFIYGAFVSNAYFKNLISKLLSVEELKRYISQQEFLLPKYQDDLEFEVACGGHSGSALVIGACNMIENAIQDVELEFVREIPPSQTYPAFIFLDENDKFKIQIGKMHYGLAKVQEVEIFLLKIRNSIDIDKLLEVQIDETNYQQVGIMEFERFAALQIIFVDSERIRPYFVLTGSVNNEEVGLNMYYQKKTYHYYTHRFSIPRKGRMERIPINEIVKVFREENEEKTWYGTEYKIEIGIKGSSVNIIKKDQIKELDEEDFKKFKNKAAIDINPSNSQQSEELVFAKDKCIICKCSLLLKSTRKISDRHINRAKNIFKDVNIVPGSCEACYNTFVEKSIQ